ncbi:MAG: LytTR family DNA-binding domain-containing protein [Cytophagales bacterium]|nr:LytTR family DNA-binding domain-containing protein [Cytophagales bacterium]
MKIKCLLVDDEYAALEGLNFMCAKYDQLEVVGTCRNGIAAIDSIRQLQPELVLLDIQMPKVNGIEVLTSLEKPLPNVIFITAHDEFAIKAFELNAIDYLLKPFTDERFDQAIQKAVEKVRAKNAVDFSSLIKTHDRPTDHTPDIRHQDEQRMVIKIDGKVHFIPKSEIICFEAYDYYVKIHTHERFYLVRETMKHLEDQLIEDQFMRTHKSYIVNKHFVQALTKRSAGNYALELAQDHQAKISRSKLNEVRDWVE